ncbi:MAG TPA: hypothetical protein VG738_08220 [Chitinophagaceae bacterium]|nr:hypothetical protein [Chitinophagaceae bacterium]
MKRKPPVNWWWLILLLLLIIAIGYYFYARPVAYSTTAIKIKSYPIDRPGNYCKYKIDTLLGKEDDPADTASSTYKKGEQVCLLCTANETVCQDSLQIEDPAGRRYGITLAPIGSSSVITCGTCPGKDIRKIQRR